MIVHQKFLGHRTDRGGLWLAETTALGQHYEAASRNSAPHELARILVAAGVPDEPMTVLAADRKGNATCASFHAMAKWTYTEGANSLQRIKWRPNPHGRLDGEAKVAGVCSETAYGSLETV